jgi:hypothetical protein
MTLLRLVFMSIVLFVLSGCGGSSGSDDTSISISTTKLDFAAVQNSSAPQTAVVDVKFNGDGAIVGYPTGVTPAPWLTIQVLSTTSANAKVQFGLITTHTPGKYSTTVRFLTGKDDGSALKYVDLAVTAEIFAPFSATAPTLAFTQIIGAEAQTTPLLGHQLAIVGDKATWSITSNVDWLTFSKTSGTGPANVAVTVTKNAGAGTGQITVTDSQSGTSKQFAVTVTRTTNQLKVTPQTLSFNVGLTTTLEQLSNTISISDTLNSAVANAAVAWTFKSASAPWLLVNVTSGTTETPQTVQVSIDPTTTALASGTYNEKLLFSYTGTDSVQRDVEVPVTVASSLPAISMVAPFQLPSQAGTMLLRGVGFNTLTAANKIKIGQTSFNIVGRDSDTQLRVGHTGFVPGSYTVQIESTSVLPLQPGSFVVPTAPTPTAQVLNAPGSRSLMLFDYERYQLYAYNETSQAIEVVSNNAGSWQISKTLPMTSVLDMALTKDSKQLLIAKGAELWSIDLTNAEWPATLLYSQAGSSCGLRFSDIATLNDNKVAIALQYSACSGYTSVHMYDLTTSSIFGTYMSFMPSVAASADCSRLLIGQNGISPEQSLQLLDTVNYQLVSADAPRSVSNPQLNRDGTRLLINDYEVLNGSVASVGNFSDATTKLRRAQLSQTSNRAYVLKFDSPRAQAPYIEVTNTGTITAGALPVERTIALDDISEEFELLSNPLLVTPDDKLLFITVPGRIYIKPVAAAVN